MIITDVLVLVSEFLNRKNIQKLELCCKAMHNNSNLYWSEYINNIYDFYSSEPLVSSLCVNNKLVNLSNTFNFNKYQWLFIESLAEYAKSILCNASLGNSLKNTEYHPITKNYVDHLWYAKKLNENYYFDKYFIEFTKEIQEIIKSKKPVKFNELNSTKLLLSSKYGNRILSKCSTTNINFFKTEYVIDATLRYKQVKKLDGDHKKDVVHILTSSEIDKYLDFSENIKIYSFLKIIERLLLSDTDDEDKKILEVTQKYISKIYSKIVSKKNNEILKKLYLIEMTEGITRSRKLGNSNLETASLNSDSINKLCDTLSIFKDTKLCVMANVLKGINYVSGYFK